MSLNLDHNTARYHIRAYQTGTLQINETLYHQSVIVFPDQLITDWRPQSIQDIHADDFEAIAQRRPSILLLGTGETLYFPPIETYGHLINLGIGIEVMNTAAACRTYTALTAENRSVAAALLIR